MICGCMRRLLSTEWTLASTHQDDAELLVNYNKINILFILNILRLRMSWIKIARALFNMREMERHIRFYFFFYHIPFLQ